MTYAALRGRSECLGDALTSLNEEEELAPLSRDLPPRWKLREFSSPYMLSSSEEDSANTQIKLIPNPCYFLKCWIFSCTILFPNFYSINLQVSHYKARIFLLVDLGGIKKSDLGSGGGGDKKALKMTS